MDPDCMYGCEHVCTEYGVCAEYSVCTAHEGKEGCEELRIREDSHYWIGEFAVRFVGLRKVAMAEYVAVCMYVRNQAIWMNVLLTLPPALSLSCADRGHACMSSRTVHSTMHCEAAPTRGE